ncbi:MAG TPA: rhodanese-like domain-containing protein [Chthoniobacterales bacterium]|nr:rhodanese-like domain-containing protein [Chthoniobacterales bacterium]
MKVGSQVFVVFLAAAVLAGLTAAMHPKRPNFPDRAAAPGEISLQEVENWKEPLLWVDARSEADYQMEHIPGAVSLNPDNWSEELPRFLDLWRPPEKAVVYCSAASCDTSREIADRLRRSGVDPVYYLKGGWEAWKTTR